MEELVDVVSRGSNVHAIPTNIEGEKRGIDKCLTLINLGQN